MNMSHEINGLRNDLIASKYLMEADLKTFETKCVKLREIISLSDELVEQIQPSEDDSHLDEEFKKETNKKIEFLEQKINLLNVTGGSELQRQNGLINQLQQRLQEEEDTTTQLVMQISGLELQLQKKDCLYMDLEMETKDKIQTLESLKLDLYKQTQALEKELIESKKTSKKSDGEVDRLLKRVAEKQFQMDKEKFAEEIKPINAELKSLRVEYKNTKEALGNAVKSYRNCKDEKISLEKQRSELEQIRRHLSKQNEDIKMKLEMETAKSEKKSTEIEQLVNENKFLHETSISNEHKIQNNQIEFQRLVDGKNDIKQKLTSKFEEIQILKREKKVLVREIKNLRSDVEQKKELIEKEGKEKESIDNRSKKKIKELKNINQEMKNQYEKQIDEVTEKLFTIYNEVIAFNETLQSCSLEQLIPKTPDLRHEERLLRATGFLEQLMPNLKSHMEKEMGSSEIKINEGVNLLKRICLQLLYDKAIFSKRVNGLRAVGVYSVCFEEIPLGFTPVPTPDENNLVVESVEPESHADYQGVLPGSIIVRMNDEDMENKGSTYGTQVFVASLCKMPLTIVFRPI